MINVENDPSGGKPQPPQGKPQIDTLTPEELKMYKDCTASSYYKAGIPFAVFCHFITMSKNKGVVIPKSNVKKGIMFLGNVILGSLLFSPVCYYRLAAMRVETMRRMKETEANEPSHRPEEVHTASRTDDFSYPIDLMTNLNEPEGNFSSDFSSFTALTDEETDIKTRMTTYDDLRARHRSRYAAQPPAPSSPLGSESRPTSGILSSPNDASGSSGQPSNVPPPRKVVKNKYGDEIE